MKSLVRSASGGGGLGSGLEELLKAPSLSRASSLSLPKQTKRKNCTRPHTPFLSGYKYPDPH